MQSIVALAGRRIDSADADVERFPLRNLNRVLLAIGAELKERGAKLLVSSAAAGTDLLGLKAAIDLKITPRIVLSPNVQEFARTSADDRGAYWKHEFESAISVVGPKNLICIPAQTNMADTFRSVNEKILSDAIALSVSESAELICLAVWDGVRRGKDDFSADFVERAAGRGLPVIHINTV